VSEIGRKIRVAIAGLRFGAAFAPIYDLHPDVESVGIIDPDTETLREVGERFGIERRHAELDEALSGEDYDAVHLVTPIPLHAQQTLAVLKSGKHCACTVPAATSLDDLRAIVAAQRDSGKNYMMMETQIYAREFLYVQQLHREGAFGRLQFLRGAHYQDMENWPAYWAGLPPMWYATHAVSPLLALADARAAKVHCFGSGYLRPELREPYGNPFPIETAIFRLDREGDPLAMEVTRALFHSARAYSESFNIYGEDATFEWQQLWCDQPVMFHLSGLGEKPGPRVTTEERIDVPDYGHLLPPEIAPFTGHNRDTCPPSHPARLHGGGHGGSHPHMVHEFVRSIVEGRPAAIDAVRAANWTAAGICAHQSAMVGGEGVEIPSFECEGK
jgi:predicted dehydrogenase